MIEYPDLFDPMANRAFARNADPETSHEAADALDGRALTRLESIVVAALWTAPLNGPPTMIGGRTTSEPASSASPRATFPPR